MVCCAVAFIVFCALNIHCEALVESLTEQTSSLSHCLVSLHNSPLSNKTLIIPVQNNYKWVIIIDREINIWLVINFSFNGLLRPINVMKIGGVNKCWVFMTAHVSYISTCVGALLCLASAMLGGFAASADTSEVWVTHRQTQGGQGLSAVGGNHSVSPKDDVFIVIQSMDAAVLPHFLPAVSRSGMSNTASSIPEFLLSAAPPEKCEDSPPRAILIILAA